MSRISLTPQAEDQALIEAVAPVLRAELPLSSLALIPCGWAPDFWSRVAELA